MKYYENEIYPIGLVLSNDVESVDREYYNAADGKDSHIVVKPTSEATTIPLTRRADYYAMAVGVVFNKEGITPKLMAHEALHVTRMMLELGCHIPLDDSSEEAWAYLIGWVMECIDKYLKERIVK